MNQEKISRGIANHLAELYVLLCASDNKECAEWHKSMVEGMLEYWENK